MELKKIKKLLGNNIELILSELNVEFEKNGENITCPCPVHGSDSPNSFSYSTDKNIWSCWSRRCQDEYSNDIIGLIQGILSGDEEEDIGFSKALTWACNVLNIDNNSVFVDKAVEEDGDEFVEMVGMFAKEEEIVQEDEQVSMDCTLSHPSEYFRKRGFKKETLGYFEVGDCNQKKSTMVQRAIIPIYNLVGEKIVAYIGRSTKDYIMPKFLFTKGFNKRRYLYNYHNAINKARETSTLFITEGQGDVWKLHEAGVMNAIGIFGKSLSEQQKRILEQSGVTRLVILTDNDQAGRESKIQIQRQMSRMFKVVFPRMSRKDVGDMTVKQIREDILPQLKGMY
jgi:DNA primase